MTKAEMNTTSAVGLDIGTSRVVAAWQDDSGYQYRSELNSFVTLPMSRLTENVLRREGVPHNVVGSSIIVHGNESERFADLLQVDTRRPMTKGTLNAAEPESMNMIRQIVQSMVGPAKEKGQKLVYSVPAAPLGASENLTYHDATLKQVLEEMGYDVKSINEGLAVVYSEMESTNYTGIGISCGGGLCNVCMAYLAVPVMQFSIPKAGDYIDSSAASVTGDIANRLRMVKEESFYFNGAFSDKSHQVLGVYYDDMITSLVGALKDGVATHRSLPKIGRQLPLVLSGGTTMPRGFRDRFEKALREADFPIALSEVRMAEKPLLTTARGALVAALSEL